MIFEEEEEEVFDCADCLSKMEGAMKYLWLDEQALIRLVQAGASGRAMSALLGLSESRVVRFRNLVVSVLKAFIWKNDNQEEVDKILTRLPMESREVLLSLESRRTRKELSRLLGISHTEFSKRVSDTMRRVRGMLGSGVDEAGRLVVIHDSALEGYLGFLDTIVHKRYKAWND